MRLILIPSLDLRGGVLETYVPYGLLSLQAVGASFETSVEIWHPPSFDRLEFDSTDELYRYVVDSIQLDDFDIVGFSTLTASFLYAVKIAEAVRLRRASVPIVFGGPFVTKLASQVLAAFPAVDAIFVGEAEQSFAELLGRCDRGVIDFCGIAGVVTRSATSCPAKVEDDLDRLPRIIAAPDYELWFRRRNPIVDRYTPIPLEASRGCPLRCSFCSTRQVWGAKVRRKSAPRLIEEMIELSDLCGGSTFFNLIGDNLGVPRAPFLEFCDELATINPGFTWGCSLKLDRLEPQHLQRMWRAGMRAMFVGLESGNQATLERVRKETDIVREIDNIRAAVDLGFRVTTSFIVGFPWEEARDVGDTISLHTDLLKHGVDRSQVNILCPIPGTDIVAEGKIVFERSWLEETSDGVATPDEMMAAASSQPALFTHFGRYETPRIDLSTLVASARQAATLDRMHRSMRPDWNRF